MRSFNKDAYDYGGSIAIIGMAGRFPGADTTERLWQNLRDGVESITFFDDDELLGSGISSEYLCQANYVKAKPILSDIESFDADFFRISPREAELMDPQHRLFLECAWEALENAAYDPDHYNGRIGIFASASKNTYLLFNVLSRNGWMNTPEVYQVLIGNEKDYLSSRVSYKLNLRGPSLTIQSACSSSLVATHLACQSLLNGECEIALAGGVAVDAPHKSGYLSQQGDVVSTDGHCRAFDASAQGTIFGQGLGIVVLRRLRDALEAGDSIHAIILASAVNNDGAQKMGFTAPSVRGQAEVILEAMAVANLHPEDITYVETHGTATILGDTVEIEALSKAFRARTVRRQYCAIGSVKTNVGHLNAASGVTGLIKTALALTHKQIPPSLHFQVPNPKIDFTNSPFFINTTLRDWKQQGRPLCAGVNSFGQGGTNCHVILQEAPIQQSSPSLRPWHFLPISARTPRALEMLSKRFIDYLSKESKRELADIAFSLMVGRKHFPYRRTVLCQDSIQAAAALAKLDRSLVWDGVSEGKGLQLVFVFPHLFQDEFLFPTETYRLEQVFRDELNECVKALAPDMRQELQRLLVSLTSSEQPSEVSAVDSHIYFLLMFAVQYALAKMWLSWGVKLALLAGNGIGKIVAAFVAGSMTLDDCVALLKGRRDHQDNPYVIDEMVSERTRDSRIPILSLPIDLRTVDQGTDHIQNRLATTLTPAVFSDPIANKLPTPECLLLEIAPNRNQLSPSRIIPGAGVFPGYTDQESSHWRHSESACLSAAFSSVWLAGGNCDWQAYYAKEQRLRIPLPTYPFERKRHWIDAKSTWLQAVPEKRSYSESPEQTEVDQASLPPQAQLQELIIEILQTTLGIDRIAPLDNFFELGGDSLLILIVAAKLREAFGLELTASMLIENPTAKQLVELIQSCSAADIASLGVVSHQDVSSEITLDSDIVVKQPLRNDISSPDEILLTGATGFLGAYLLSGLLRRTKAHLHCLVRAADKEAAYRRLQDTLVYYGLWEEGMLARISVLPGDLRERQLGLDDSTFHNTAEVIDAIYHAGALVNFLLPYNILKQTNVYGTQEILRLATAKRLTPVYFVSSTAVYETDCHKKGEMVFEEAPIDQSPVFRNAYSLTKWMAEMLITIARSRGIPVSVFRASNIAGHSKTGIMHNKHIIANFIRGCIQLGAVPGDDDNINVLPVDTASAMLIELSLQPETLNKNFHVVNPQTTCIRNIKEALETSGYPLKRITFKKWRAAIKSDLRKNVFRPFLELIGAESIFSNLRFDLSNGLRWAPGAIADCPAFDANLLRTYLSYLGQAGLIDKPTRN